LTLPYKKAGVRLHSLSKKSLGLFRVVTLNPHIPAVPVHPAQYDRPFRAVSLCVLPPGSPKDERQNVVTPSKNKFFDGLTPHGEPVRRLHAPPVRLFIQNQIQYLFDHIILFLRDIDMIDGR
jgi:hypothetical protein